jgi:hypothetical protein
MKTATALGLLLLCIAGTASAANVHNVTWVRKAVAPGTIVSIGGQNFVLVRLPLKEFTNGNRYIVEYLEEAQDLGPPVTFNAQVSATHSTDALVNPVTVSGYPANIAVQDLRQYNYADGTGFQDGLEVDAWLFASVTLKVGDTALALGTFFSTTQQNLTSVPSGIFSSSSYANWNQYTDPTALVTHFDNWLDYVRVLKIN